MFVFSNTHGQPQKSNDRNSVLASRGHARRASGRQRRSQRKVSASPRHTPVILTMHIRTARFVFVKKKRKSKHTHIRSHDNVDNTKNAAVVSGSERKTSSTRLPKNCREGGFLCTTLLPPPPIALLSKINKKRTTILIRLHTSITQVYGMAGLSI